MPSKTIILLDRKVATDGSWSIRYVLWADVVAERWKFHANPEFESAYKDADPQEITDLKMGCVVEKCDTAGFSKETTIQQARTYLEGLWQAHQNAVNGLQNWAHYGTHRLPDGSWVVKGV